MTSSMIGSSGNLAIIENFKKQSEIPHIESGTINVQFSTTIRAYNITFKNAFKEPPVVQLTVSSGQFGSHSRALIDGTPKTTGFKFRTYNNDSTADNGIVHWLAVEKSTE